jgi:type IV pilus biogenesis protein CpaD/CtpE
MKHLRLPILAALLGLFTLLATGCTSRSAADNSIPWGRPQNWEGQIPGMGTTPGSGAR